MRGWLVVDKPAGPTAHDIVAQARRRLRFKKIGHSGTLDPPATGVLVLALGPATRLLRFLPSDKTYWARMAFGATTSTLDATGEVLTTADVNLGADALAAALESFKGLITQLPPMVSAVQVDGQRLYDLARKGLEVERPTRQVTVYAIEMLAWTSPYLDVRIHCSAGTYIRTIADDLGRMLGPGAYLAQLRRERANGLDIGQSVNLETIDDASLQAAVLPLDQPLLSLPAVVLSDSDSGRFRHGNALSLEAPVGTVRLYHGEELLGVGDSSGRQITAAVVLVDG